jgi:hypothetical protein
LGMIASMCFLLAGGGQGDGVRSTWGVGRSLLAHRLSWTTGVLRSKQSLVLWPFASSLSSACVRALAASCASGAWCSDRKGNNTARLVFIIPPPLLLTRGRFFDASKQALAASLVHLFNVFFSDFLTAHSSDHDPCTWCVRCRVFMCVVRSTDRGSAWEAQKRTANKA